MRKLDKLNHIRKVNLLTEDRQNNERVVTELLGLSKQERMAKKQSLELKQSLEEAYSEIDNFLFKSVIAPMPNSKSYQDMINIIDGLLKQAATMLPTVAKLVPDLFDGNKTKVGTIHQYTPEGNLEPGIMPSTWLFALKDEGSSSDKIIMDNNDDSIVKFKQLIEKKINQSKIS